VSPEAVKKKVNTIASNTSSVTGENKDSFLFFNPYFHMIERNFENLKAVVMIIIFKGRFMPARMTWSDGINGFVLLTSHFSLLIFHTH
jgi:hypothetical protein